MNPLVPSAFDGVLIAGALGTVILACAACVSLLLNRTVTGWSLLAWALVILFVPIIGPAAWFIARRRERARAQG